MMLLHFTLMPLHLPPERKIEAPSAEGSILCLKEPNREKGEFGEYLVLVPCEENSYVLKEEGVESVVISGVHCAAKIFRNKEIWLPTEATAFREKFLSRETKNIAGEVSDTRQRCFVMITGYSSSKILEQRGAKPGSYVAAVEYVEMETAKELLSANRRPVFIHGVSDVGVDAATKNTIDALADQGVQGVGFSCPAYMLYVKDDNRGGPVLVAPSKDLYSQWSVQDIDALIITVGTNHALDLDHVNAIKNRKRSVPADVSPMITPEGVPGSEHKPMNQGGGLSVLNAARYVQEQLGWGGRRYDNIEMLALHAAAEVRHLVENNGEILEAPPLPMREVTKTSPEELTVLTEHRRKLIEALRGKR